MDGHDRNNAVGLAFQFIVSGLFIVWIRCTFKVGDLILGGDSKVRTETPVIIKHRRELVVSIMQSVVS